MIKINLDLVKPVDCLPKECPPIITRSDIGNLVNEFGNLGLKLNEGRLKLKSCKMIDYTAAFDDEKIKGAYISGEFNLSVESKIYKKDNQIMQGPYITLIFDNDTNTELIEDVKETINDYFKN